MRADKKTNNYNNAAECWIRFIWRAVRTRRGIINFVGGSQGRLCGVVQLLSHVWHFVTPWTAAHQACLSFTICWTLLKLISTESVMPSNHLILCCPLLLPPSTFPSIKVFSYEMALHTRWLQLQHQSFQWIFRVDFLEGDFWAGTLRGVSRWDKRRKAFQEEGMTDTNTPRGMETPQKCGVSGGLNPSEVWCVCRLSGRRLGRYKTDWGFGVRHEGYICISLKDLDLILWVKWQRILSVGI